MTQRDEALRVVHGLRMILPPTWEDTSVYRFQAPFSEADESGSNLRLMPNVLVSRQEKRPGDSPEKFLELATAEQKKENPSLQVARAGTVMYFDQIAQWQDTRFTDPRTSAEVFQRWLVVPTWPKHFTLLTLTGSQRAIEKMSDEIGLSHLDEPAGGSRVTTAAGTVAGVLVSPVQKT